MPNQYNHQVSLIEEVSIKSALDALKKPYRNKEANEKKVNEVIITNVKNFPTDNIDTEKYNKLRNDRITALEALAITGSNNNKYTIASKSLFQNSIVNLFHGIESNANFEYQRNKKDNVLSRCG